MTARPEQHGGKAHNTTQNMIMARLAAGHDVDRVSSSI
jgi:hypothetical protein